MTRLGCMTGFTTATVCPLRRPSSPRARPAGAASRDMSISVATNAAAQQGMNVRMRLNDESPNAPLHGSDVCAIVVTYHPDAALAVRLGRIAPQVGAIVMVDNGSTD